MSPTCTTDLFSSKQETFAIIDGQWCKDLYGRLLADETVQWISLLGGELARELALSAPYLVRLDDEQSFTHWLLQSGWGKGWGIFLSAPRISLLELSRQQNAKETTGGTSRNLFSNQELEHTRDNSSKDSQAILTSLRNHFRRFAHVEWGSDGRIVRFRFFDPAVLRVWLLSSNAAEIADFFGPISQFATEDWCDAPLYCSDEHIWRFSKSDKAPFLITEKLNLSTGTTTSVKQFGASKQGKMITNRPHRVVRQEQLESFEKSQQLIFLANASENYQQIKNRNSVEKITILEALSETQALAAEALNYGLSSERSVTGFLYAAAQFGSNFAREHSSFRSALMVNDSVEFDLLVSELIDVTVRDTLQN